MDSWSEEELRQLAQRHSRAAELLAKTIFDHREDWMLDDQALLHVVAYTAALIAAHFATEKDLRIRISDAEAIFLNAFRQHFAEVVDTKRLMRFL